jgi:deoxyribodipyrimidine photo-lyase
VNLDLQNFPTDLPPERIQLLNAKPLRAGAKYVLYWVQKSSRAEWNHAFEYAVRLSKALDCGVVAAFGLMSDYPGANARHYQFLLQGLQQAAEDFKKRDTKFVLRFGHPAEVTLALASEATAVVCDRGYLRHERAWRQRVADEADCAVVQVETDVIVPVETASDKQEYAARTIRKKLMRQYEDFLAEPARPEPGKSSLRYRVTGEDFSDIPSVIAARGIDRSVPAVDWIAGGTQEAKRRFRQFLAEKLNHYDEDRSAPHLDTVSFMSPYLHFGQISPCWLVSELRQHHGENAASYLEELLVRRELTANFCFYNADYDNYHCLPDWAAQTLEAHREDEREAVYTREELENGQTKDPYWNAAMLAMRERGYLHNHMRMYWGKQILRFTNTPRYAYQTALYLNNKYFLDGRDHNSFANIAWLFGLHDRGWKEREVFGKVRIMTPGGLERKTDPEQFMKKVNYNLDESK